MATRKKKIDQVDSAVPAVVRGNHLTVITNPDGTTQLIWDDTALLQEVRAAIASVPSKQPSSGRKKSK